MKPTNENVGACLVYIVIQTVYLLFCKTKVIWYLKFHGERHFWRFVLIFFHWFVVRSQFFLWPNYKCQAVLSNILNMVEKSTANFLEGLKEKFHLKNVIFSDYPILRLIVWKSQLFSMLLTYNLTSVSCGHDFLDDDDLETETRFFAPSRYLENVSKTLQKFSKGFWEIHFTSKNDIFPKYSNLILSLKKPYFLRWNFSFKTSRRFAVDFTNVCKMFERTA